MPMTLLSILTLLTNGFANHFMSQMGVFTFILGCLFLSHVNANRIECGVPSWAILFFYVPYKKDVRLTRIKSNGRLCSS